MALGCYFTASGRRFEADSFLATTTLKPDAVFHRGDPLTPLDGRVQETGFSVTICTTRVFGDLERQIPRAHRFLREHQRELARLAHDHRVTDLRLTFPYCPGDRMGYEHFPAELLALAATCRISIALSVYPGPPSSGDARMGKPNHALHRMAAPPRGLATRESRRGRHR